MRPFVSSAKKAATANKAADVNKAGGIIYTYCLFITYIYISLNYALFCVDRGSRGPARGSGRAGDASCDWLVPSATVMALLIENLPIRSSIGIYK